MQRYGTGAINIDGCRIKTDEDRGRNARGGDDGLCGESTFRIRERRAEEQPVTSGRWPANILHDGGEEAEDVFPMTNGGSVSRFFYCAKATLADREEGCEALDEKLYGQSNGAQIAISRGEIKYQEGEGSFGMNILKKRKNNHPTVKPIALMRYLCKLVTPPEGLILDPFMGSGSTGKAAALEGFGFWGFELDASFLPIAEARIRFALGERNREQLTLF